MAPTTKAERWIVVGPATIETQVGAGRARVDLPVGSDLPDNVSQEDRDALKARGAIRLEKADIDVDSVPAAGGAPVVRPVPGVVEPDEIPRDLIPGGSVKGILDWVGDDLARARLARDAETAKGPSARASLLKALDAVKADIDEEPQPLGVPEAADPNIAGGRVDTPVVATDAPADTTSTSKKTATK